jgi:hypothetical protein
MKTTAPMRAVPSPSGQALPQSLLDGAQKAVQHGVLQFGVVEVVAQPFRQREHPLPHRQGGEDVIDQMGGGFDHAPGGARGADATTLAGVGDDEIVTAVGAAGTGKAVGEDAAVEVAAEFAFAQRRDSAARSVVLQRQPGGEVRLHEPVEQRSLRAPALIDGRLLAGLCGLGGHAHPDRGIGMGNCMHIQLSKQATMSGRLRVPAMLSESRRWQHGAGNGTRSIPPDSPFAGGERSRRSGLHKADLPLRRFDLHTILGAQRAVKN